MNMRSRSFVVLAAVTAGLTLSGCSWLRNAAGMDKMSPDEFAVLTKAPLVMPPDFGLMPPKPGAAPTNQSDPASNAQASLFGADVATVAANIPGNASMGEKMLLAQSGAANADSSIRQQIAADDRDLLAADDKFTNQLMFWEDQKKDTGAAVNADAEAARIAAGKGQPPRPQVQNQNTLPPAKSEVDKEDSGWFGGLFDWF